MGHVEAVSRSGTYTFSKPNQETIRLRNPCVQLDHFQHGLMKAVLGRAEDGELIRKAGVMTVVIQGGDVRPGDPIALEYPPEPHIRLAPV